ncbi:MAG: hypothetical protein QHJ73_18900, partial [Armatimonadota bacterium]|nr:hypothetical protein [Armatimonadota bacterium]
MRHFTLLLILCTVVLAKGAAVGAPGKIDLEVWKKYRDQVVHPATTIKPADLERARRNQELYPWARAYVQRLRTDCDRIVTKVSPEYLQHMVERTSPGCTGPCPACRAKGLPWHPNGQWSWSESQPDQLTCRVCNTVFPHPDFPEEVVLQSKWDPEQKFTFVGGEPFNCFGYLARPSLSGIIRERKLSAVTSYLNTLTIGYALTGDPRYAEGVRLILLRFAEVLPRYLVRAGYGYGETADCDPHLAAENISNLPTDELVVPPNKPDRRLHTGYWSASRIGSAGMDGGWVSRVALAYDLTCTARRDGTPIYSAAERER